MATNILLMQKIGKSFSYIVIATLVAITSLFALPIGVSASGALAFAGGSTINGLTDVYVPVTGLTLTGTSADPAIPVTLSVPRGQLSMTTTTGLTFTGSPTGSNLAFSGSQADINAALATLRYRTTRAETVQLTATLTSPGVVYFPGNGHMYEVIDHGSGISWDDAKVAAEGLTKNGAQGYLATITSQAENDYLLGKLIGDGWFGASDAQTEDDWKWVTGPEAGTSFWQGLGDGSPVGGLFSNWASGEPNNAGNEDCAQFYSSGSGWNDLPCDGPYLNYYVVEYGTDGALPVAPSSTTSTITTSFPTPDDIDISSCLDLIDVADNAGDHRYDNLSLAGDIDCNGEVLSPLFNETDPDLGTMGFRGTFDGNGHTISNITVDANADNTGFIANTDGATIRDLSINGQVKGGDSCTGGLVGSALNTVFDNVDVNVDVTSYATYSYRMGGIVGCLDTDTDSSSVENSSALGSVTGYAYLGGIVGAVTGNAGGTTTMTGNTSNVGIIASSGYSIGGAAGRVDVEDEDTLVTLAGNTTMGVSASDSYTVGGLVGEADADDGAKIEFTQNTIGGNVEAGGRAGGLIGGAYVYDGAQVTASNFHFIYGTTANNSYAGGIVGEVNAEGSSFDTKFVISSSSVSGAVNADSNAGGLIGEIDWDYGEEDLLVTNSHVSGDVTSSNGDAGGIASSAHGLRIANSYTTGVIVSGGAAGGLIGEAGDTQVSESYATGNVTSTSDGVGGLVGKNGNNAQITESYATGNVEGNSRVGGIVGANGNGAVVRDAYARGNVSGDSNVGGVAGRCGYGSLENVYATGAVTGPVTTGGVLGQNSGSCTIVDSFWDTQTTGLGTSAAGATSKTSVQMKSKSTFTTVTTGLVTPWNFTTIWGVNGAINNGYPCLLWQASGCGDSDDGDNVSNVMEGNAPNNGDANNDGTVDLEQSNVASFVNNVTQDYTSLEVDQVCGLTSVSSAAESSNAKSDAVYTYQNGLVGFTANCGTPGYTSTIKQYYYGAQLSPGMVLRKYNPTTQTYFTVEDATLSSVTVGGRSAVMVVYTITDGGNLDVDGVQNGVIVDPVGIATLTGTGELASTGERQGIFVGAAVALVSVAGLALGGVLVVSIRQKHRLHRR